MLHSKPQSALDRGQIIPSCWHTLSCRRWLHQTDNKWTAAHSVWLGDQHFQNIKLRGQEICMSEFFSLPQYQEMSKRSSEGARERLSNCEVPRSLHTSGHLIAQSSVRTHRTGNRNWDPGRQNHLSQRYIDYPPNSIMGINLASNLACSRTSPS